MKTCVFIAIVGVGLSGGRFSGEKSCCISSKTWEKNVCRGSMIELSTGMARVAEVDRGILWEIDRKCLNHARVQANAQSFDRCEPVGSITSRCSGDEPALLPELRPDTRERRR